MGIVDVVVAADLLLVELPSPGTRAPHLVRCVAIGLTSGSGAILRVGLLSLGDVSSFRSGAVQDVLGMAVARGLAILLSHRVLVERT